jgi:CRP-like cAMP-binding protein
VGEQALINDDSSRTATIQAETAMRTLVLHRDQFNQIKGSLDVLLAVAERIPQIRLLNQSQRSILADRMVERIYEAGAPLVTQGEDGDEMFVVVKGGVKVDFTTAGGQVYGWQYII